MAKIECPYCGNGKIHPVGIGKRYSCPDCGRLFDKDDIERENLRHQMSPLLNGTSEENPKEIYFMIPSAEEEACGLSSLEIPHIDKIFEMEGEGTMWFHIEGECENPFRKKGEKEKLLWHDLDEMSLDDLRELLEYLRKE